jgi:hypothetical protein
LIPNRRYVVHIDILGYSALISDDGDKAWDLLSSLVEANDEVKSLGIKFLDKGAEIKFEDQIHSVMFSDTVVMFSKSDELIDLQAIIVAAAQFLNDAFVRCVPIRIGIQVGNFRFNLEESMYAGKALVDAYFIGEEAQWLGISISYEVYREIAKVGWKSGNLPIAIKYDIPTKAGSKPGYSINWPNIYRESIKTNLPISAEEMYGGFKQFFGPFEDLPETAKVKYVNTAKFINETVVKQKM